MIINIIIFLIILNVSISVRSNEIGKFTYLKDSDRKNCVKMFNKGDLKYDKVADIYFKENKTPLSGIQKQYTCNKPNQTEDIITTSKNILKENFAKKEYEERLNRVAKDEAQIKSKSNFNIFGNLNDTFSSLIPGKGLVGQSNNYVNNMNQTENSVNTNNSNNNNQNTNIFGSVAAMLGNGIGQNQSNIHMRNALLHLNKAQVNFLQALEEDELALATKAYVQNLESGTVLGDDYLEKALVQSKANQDLINEKMLDVEKMSVEAKAEFAKGIPSYSLGLASLVQCGFSFKNTVDAISGGIGGIVSAIGLAVTAKDALTAIPLFFSSSGKIIEFSKQNDIDANELETAKKTLGT